MAKANVKAKSGKKVASKKTGKTEAAPTKRGRSSPPPKGIDIAPVAGPGGDPVLHAVAGESAPGAVAEGPEAVPASPLGDLNLADDRDRSAAEAVAAEKGKGGKVKKTRGRPARKSGADKAPDLPEAAALLDPDAIRTLVTITNNRLRERLPRWAMTDKEEGDFTLAFNKLIDKYLPEDISLWSPEVIFLFVGVMYALPRIVEVRSERKAEKADAEKAAAAELEPASSEGIDLTSTGPDDPRLKAQPAVSS